MSGGFSGSEHLLNSIRKNVKLKGIKERNVVRGPDPWLAVVRGAVAMGIEAGGGLTSVRGCPRHYGTVTSQPFSYKHSGSRVYKDQFDGQLKAHERMTWLVHQGDSILSDRPIRASVEFCRRFGVHDPRNFVTKFVACDDDEAPEHYSDIPTR